MTIPDKYRIGLHPRLIDAVEELLNEALARKLRAQVYSGLRTFQEQSRLYALGRTIKNPDGASEKKPLGNIVTKADAGQSWHNYGCSVDISFVNDKGTLFWPKDDDPRWLELGQCGEVFGLEWGGRWHMFPDRPHFQKRGKFRNVQEAKAVYDKGGMDAVWGQL